MWYFKQFSAKELKNIRKFFKGYQRLSRSAINKFAQQYIDIFKKLEALSEFPISCYLNSILKHKKLPYCKICHAPCQKIDAIYCSKQCQYTDQIAINKKVGKAVKKHFNEKYNVDNPGQLQSVKEKIKTTNIERYGVENQFQRDTIKKLVPHKKHLSLNTIKKIKCTYHSGKANINKEAKEKLLSKSWNTVHKWQKYIKPLFSRAEWHGYNSKNIYTFECQLCHHQFSTKIYTTRHIPGEDFAYMPRCLHCFPILTGPSKMENDLVNFCKEFFPTLITNDRNLIKPFELDIYIPEIKLAIEFNGNFWHEFNSIHGVKSGYHLNKTKLCNKLGVRLIHIWEDEWTSKQDFIKNQLQQVFSNTEPAIDTLKIIDLAWYNNFNFNIFLNYDLIPPQLINRDGYLVENCGYLRKVEN